MRIIVGGNLCECGCGQRCKNRFISGHNRRGTTHICSEETKMQVSAILMGHSVSQDTRDKIRLGHIGKVGWKKGLTKETDTRVLAHSEAMQARFPKQEKIEKFCECGCNNLVKTHGSRFLRGHSNNAREKVHPSQETKDKMKVARIHFYHPEWTLEQIEFDILHENDKSLCLCGCGKNTKSRNSKFFPGHNRVGISSWNKGLTKETNTSVARASEKQKGRVVSEITRKKLQIANAGKGAGKPRSEETKAKIRIKSLGRVASTETIEKLRVSHIGLKQTDETVAKRIRGMGQKRFAYVSVIGEIIRMRSNWERLYAAYLDSLDIFWVYENKGFKLSNGHRYFPDFYLPDLNEYHEVKGWMSNRSINKIGLFRKEYPEEKLVLVEKIQFHKNELISYKKDGVIVS